MREKSCKKKRGRPPKEGARRHQAKTRFNDIEYEELMKISEKSGETCSDILRDAFNMYKVLRKIQLNIDENDNF